MTKKILFVGYDASKTGAPILLLDIAKSINKKGQFLTDFLFDSGGALIFEFSTLGNVYTLTTKSERIPFFKRIYNRIKRVFYKSLKQQIFKKLKKNKYDILYINTIATIPLFLELIPYISTKTICHVHEMEMAIQIFCDNHVLEKADKHIDRYIAVSEAVKDNLIFNHNIPDTKIELVYGYSSTEKSALPKNELFNKYRIPEGKYIIGCVGRADLIKGFDIFINIAKILSLKEHNFIFVWIGSIPDENRSIIFESIKRLNIQEKIIFTGSINHTTSFYQLFDIFLHTSREDSFPLSIIEAAQNGLPIISFEGSGGSNEFITKTGSGMLVPYLDGFKMAMQIIELKSDKNLYKKLSDNALNAIKTFNREKSIEKIEQVFENLS